MTADRDGTALDASIQDTSKRPEPRLIASLTTYPQRIASIEATLDSLLSQSHKPDMLILWLSLDQFPGALDDVPDHIAEYRQRGLDIRFRSGDLRSHKKHRYVLEEFPDDILVTFDDDIIYREDTIEVLWQSYLRHPDCISALRAHLMRFDDEGYVLPYLEWEFESSRYVDEPRMDLFATTGGGTLFPPHCLHSAVFDDDAMMECCPRADDVWIKLMHAMAGTLVVVPEKQRGINEVTELSSGGLWRENVRRGGNDFQLAKAIGYCTTRYGFDEKLLSHECFSSNSNTYLESKSRYEDALCDRKRIDDSRGVEIPYEVDSRAPCVSIVAPVHNPGPGMVRFVESLRNQTLSNIEMVFVDDDDADGSMLLVERYVASDSRFRIIRNSYQVGYGPSCNIGLEAAHGDYIAFVYPEDYLEHDFIELLYTKAVRHDADVVKGTNVDVVQSGREVACSAANDRIAKGLPQGHALYSLFRDEHWTAIFRRDLLMSNGVRFGSSSSETGATFLIRVCSVTGIFALARDAKYYHVQRSGLAIRSLNPKWLHDELTSLEEAIDCLLEHGHQDEDAVEYMDVQLSIGLSAQSAISATKAGDVASQQFLHLACRQLSRLPWIGELKQRAYYLEALIEDEANLRPVMRVLGMSREQFIEGTQRIVSNWADYLETHPDRADRCENEAIAALINAMRFPEAVEEYETIDVDGAVDRHAPTILADIRENARRLSNICPSIRERASLRAFVDHGINLAMPAWTRTPFERAAAVKLNAQQWVAFVSGFADPDDDYVKATCGALRWALRAHLDLLKRPATQCPESSADFTSDAATYLDELRTIARTSSCAKALARMGIDMRALIECGANICAPIAQKNNRDQLQVDMDTARRWISLIESNPIYYRCYGKGMLHRVDMMYESWDSYVVPARFQDNPTQ